MGQMYNKPRAWGATAAAATITSIQIAVGTSSPATVSETEIQSRSFNQLEEYIAHPKMTSCYAVVQSRAKMDANIEKDLELLELLELLEQ
jgi:hypothetical protein